MLKHSLFEVNEKSLIFTIEAYTFIVQAHPALVVTIYQLPMLQPNFKIITTNSIIIL